MSEKNNVAMEKIYFKYILENPDQFSKVDPHFFKNEDISFIYGIIREEYLLSPTKVLPSPKQIWTMLNLQSEIRQIENTTLKALLNNDISTYGDDWLVPKFKSWKLSNKVKDNVFKSIDYVRNVDENDYDNIKNIISKIKNITNEIDLVDDDNGDDVGDDFDDPTKHRQDETTQKISTGWATVDNMLNGGWDYASLVVFIGETNVGKCSFSSTSITVKDVRTGCIKNVDIGGFHELFRK